MRLPAPLQNRELDGCAGTASTFRALKEVFCQYGLPDESSTRIGARALFLHDQGGGEIDRSHPTQVGRALEQLGVEAHRGLFAAGAWGARSGRSERCRTGW